MSEDTERWLPYPGYAGFYEVSDRGNVMSLPRETTRGKLLKAQISSKGYRQVGLSKYGKVTIRRVGRMVLETFDKPCPPGHEACHGPGGQLDDSLDNLSWGTASKNQGEDRVRDGTDNRGERNVRSKLTGAIVLECRRRYATGESQVALAREFSVSPESMNAAICGRTWANIPGPVTGTNQGERSATSKLTEAIVLECRRRYNAKEATQTELAAEFGVGSGAMSMAIRGRTWGHLTEGIPDPGVDGRSLISTPDMRERRREYGRKGAVTRWGER